MSKPAESALPPLDVSYEDDPRVVKEAATEDYSLHIVPRTWRMGRWPLTMAWFAVATAFFYMYFAAFLALAYGTWNALIGIALTVITYALVNITWVFFRAHAFDKAWQLLGGMFGANREAAPILPTMHLVIVTLIVGGIVAAHWSMRGRTLEMAVATVRPVMLAGIWASMAVAIVIAQAAGNAFIYFQF